MLTGIDHLVVVVPDLAQAMRDYSDLGFTVVPGGRHPGGSHNALIGLADGAYIELLSFEAPNPRHRWWSIFQRVLREGACLADFCMATDNLDGEAQVLRQAGITMDDPHPGSRLRPDGYAVTWVLSTPPAGQAGLAPFLIQDVTPRAERVPTEREHRNRVTGIDTLTIATDDLRWVRLWGELLRAHPAADANLIRLEIGRHVLQYQSPQSASDPLSAWLRARGPSPYQATLRRADGSAWPLPVGASLDTP